jgi:hypothetical protein
MKYVKEFFKIIGYVILLIIVIPSILIYKKIKQYNSKHDRSNTRTTDNTSNSSNSNNIQR